MFFGRLAVFFALPAICSLELCGAEKAPTTEEINRAIQQLGDDNFAARTKATNFLWKAGRAAEPALRAAQKSKDPEIAFRVRQILDKFKYGIYPDTPRDVLVVINQYRSGNASQKRSALQQLQTMGEIRTLIALLKIEPDESLRRQIATGFLANAQKVLPELFQQGDFEQAEQLLELASPSTIGMRHYAAFLQLRGKLDEKIDELTKRIGQAASTTDGQLLVYLWRAKGDLAQARKAAEAAGNEALLKNVLYEAQDWAALAKIHRRPDPFGGGGPGDVQSLGFKAAYFRLSNDQKAYQMAIDHIQQKGTTDKQQVWYCAEALLINDRAEDAIQLFKQHRPRSAFRLLCEQSRYGEAFDVIGLPKPGGEYGPWIDQLVEDVLTDDKEKKNRIHTGLDAARTLYRLGEKDTAKTILQRLAAAVSDDGGDHMRLRSVCGAAVKLGLTDFAAEHLSLVFADGMDATAVKVLYPKDSATAQIWWQFFRGKHPDEPHQATLGRIRKVMRPDAKQPVDLDQLVADAKTAADALDAGHRRSWYPALGKTCLTHKRRDLALPFFEELANLSDVPAMMQMGDLLAEDEQWDTAGQWYRKAWELDKRRVIALFLAGRSLIKSGKEDEGTKLTTQATLLPLGDEKMRKDLADGLKQRGLTDEAKAQWQLLLRTGTFGGWYVNNAAQNYGNAVSGTDDLFAAACWERLALSVLKTSSAFIEIEGYLKLPHLIHKARAVGLFKKGDVDAAIKEAWLSHAASPGNSRFIEDIIPILEKAGRGTEADKLFEKSYAMLMQVCDEFPNSAMHHNNLAWMSARSGRRLKEALAYAQEAVAMEPENAGYVDTLGEAYFRLGERDKAIDCAKRCLADSPANDHFQKQLKRFQEETSPPATK